MKIIKKHQVDEDKFPHFPETNILGNKKTETDDFLQLSLTWCDETLKNFDQIFQNNMQNIMQTTQTTSGNGLVTKVVDNSQLDYPFITHYSYLVKIKNGDLTIRNYFRGATVMILLDEIKKIYYFDYFASANWKWETYRRWQLTSTHV